MFMLLFTGYATMYLIYKNVGRTVPKSANRSAVDRTSQKRWTQSERRCSAALALVVAPGRLLS